MQQNIFVSDSLSFLLSTSNGSTAGSKHTQISNMASQSARDAAVTRGTEKAMALTVDEAQQKEGQKKQWHSC